MSAETERLAMLEATLVGAAAAQASRRRRRRRRGVVLAAVVAPLVLVAGGSVARTGSIRGVDHNLSVLRDDRLAARASATAELTSAAGSRPRDHESERSWRVGTQRVVGYTTASGRFCYRFVSLGGGCLSQAALTHARPLDPTADHMEGLLRIYGLATDEVTGVTVRTHGTTRRAAMGRNAFYLQLNSLGDRQGLTLTLVAHFHDGGIRRVRIAVGEMDRRLPTGLPALPGALAPLEDTAV